MQTQQVKLSKLNIDKRFTEIRPVNEFFVSTYRQNYRHGADMPPPIVDKEDYRVISGNHRVTAALKEFGEDHKIAVILKKYDSERERLKEFAQENTRHGNAMDGITRHRMILAMLQEGTPDEEVASIFNRPVKWVETLRERGVAVTEKIGGKEINTIKPAKRGLEPEQPINPKDYRIHLKEDRGVHVVTLVSQLNRWLHNGWVRETPENIGALTILKQNLDVFLKKAKKAA